MTYSRARKSWWKAKRRRLIVFWCEEYYCFLRIGRHQWDFRRYGR